ncbi:MAG: 16S rRNA (guanine(966)-N(2))-methyltransferase RsmD [Spirochaetales bacterium]|nr:MAG: 16S rRNA (guanine(966)-N(2))-methyltransferase RsmD [Spirochaetales bacterium]
MRVTGGRYRGRIVEVPKGPYEIRPAMDRMRESIFSVLGDLTGRSFLDLFSGSGIVGLEAASRGAAPVVCVERDRAKFPVLIRNVSIALERIECHCLPVERYLLRLDRSFSVIFCDPPFPYAHKAELIRSAGERGALEPGGLLLLHYPKGEVLPEAVGDIVTFDERVYGRSIVRIYRRGEGTGSTVE